MVVPHRIQTSSTEDALDERCKQGGVDDRFGIRCAELLCISHVFHGGKVAQMQDDHWIHVLMYDFVI